MEETFPDREAKILKFWKDNQIFQKSLKNREKKARYVIYDGPPFATGLPHYGHLLAGTIKDVIPRYQTMKGYYVPRRFGWDCHGLPVEQEVEKSFNLSGAPSIEAFGIPRFNEECRKIVLRYTEEWKTTVERMGRWVDFKETWNTMDTTYMESVWWAFKTIYEKGLVYEGYKVMPFSTKLGTPLSNFEAAENYKDVDDPSLVVKFQVAPEVFLLVWTTTPWTLVSNMAATVGGDIDYVKVEYEKAFYILARNSLEKWFKDKEYKIIDEYKGRDLVGTTYEPLFPYFADKKKEGAFRVVADGFVSTDEGTGIVHTAPAFGEEDFYVCKKENIPLVCPVDNNGHFTDEVTDFKGMYVKDADKAIAKRLKAEGKLFYQGTIFHRYPFCWRSDTPLIYKAITTWFVKVEELRDKLVEANRTVHWTPSHLKEGRFGRWLEGARDWAISRNRYWGTPIPIWRSDDGDIHVMGSISEIEELTGKKIEDIHRHFIDDLTFVKNGKTYKRIPEVFDCWFDTGAMPYAHNHYPFENKERTEATHPADCIAEGVDQTRGWFYTLMILSVALFGKAPYKNVIANGILLAEDGNKMSKRLKNYPEPEIVIEKYGADAIRLYMLSSPAVKADDLRFSERGVELVLRQMLIPLLNAKSFFLTYSDIYKWDRKELKHKPKAILDRWILSQLHRLIHEVEEGMKEYDLSRAVDPFVGFIDQLTNWYIRRSRRRFWADEASQDRDEAFGTLYTVLLTLSKIAAPFTPFLSEAIYQDLRKEEMPESVHLCDYPIHDEHLRDKSLEEAMEALQVAVSCGHALRKEQKIKVRQPLPAFHICTRDKTTLKFLEEEKHLIEDELNVKSVELHAEPRDFVSLAIKPNFRVLGKKVGSKIKEVQLVISNLNKQEIESLHEGHSLSVLLEGSPFTLTPEDVEIKQVASQGWAAMHAGKLTVALDTTLNHDLILEGMAREVINKINTMRREANFDVTDRINVAFATNSALLQEALELHLKTIKEEILAIEFDFIAHDKASSWDINGEPASIFVQQHKP